MSSQTQSQNKSQSRWLYLKICRESGSVHENLFWHTPPQHTPAPIRGWHLDKAQKAPLTSLIYHTFDSWSLLSCSTAWFEIYCVYMIHHLDCISLSTLICILLYYFMVNGGNESEGENIAKAGGRDWNCIISWTAVYLYHIYVIHDINCRFRSTHLYI